MCKNLSPTKTRRGNCLVLPHTGYALGDTLATGLIDLTLQRYLYTSEFYKFTIRDIPQTIPARDTVSSHPIVTGDPSHPKKRWIRCCWLRVICIKEFAKLIPRGSAVSNIQKGSPPTIRDVVFFYCDDKRDHSLFSVGLVKFLFIFSPVFVFVVIIIP